MSCQSRNERLSKMWFRGLIGRPYSQFPLVEGCMGGVIESQRTVFLRSRGPGNPDSVDRKA